MSEVSEVSAVSVVSEVSVSTTPSPFPASSVINFSELAKEQLSCPDILPLKVFPTLRLVTVPVQDGSLQRRKFSAPWFHLLKGLTFFPPYMEYHILEFEHADDLFLQGLSGGA